MKKPIIAPSKLNIILTSMAKIATKPKHMMKKTVNILNINFFF